MVSGDGEGEVRPYHLSGPESSHEGMRGRPARARWLSISKTGGQCDQGARLGFLRTGQQEEEEFHEDHAVAAATLLALAAISSPTVGQEKTIGGVVVPREQLEAVQVKCEELLAGLTPDATTQAAEAPAAGASDNAAATESTVEAPVEPAAPDASTPVAVIDLETLTASTLRRGRAFRRKRHSARFGVGCSAGGHSAQ